MHKTTLLLIGLLLSGAAQAATPDTTHAVDPWEKRLNPEGLLVLDWDDLIPPNFDPDKVFETVAGKYGIKELDDSDPRAAKIQAEIQQLWSHAPIVTSLHGRRVRLPGLVLPLEGDGKQMSEFLLVPYFGACIHVPPPPSNQIVYVKTGPKKAHVGEIYEAVWVTGKLLTEYRQQEMGDAGYTIEAEKVEPYE
jgi:hypothetical protein